jgi:hypothetical protein
MISFVGVQYGFQDQLCMPLLDAVRRNESVVPPYVNYTINVWGGVMGTPDEYGYKVC